MIQQCRVSLEAAAQQPPKAGISGSYLQPDVSMFDASWPSCLQVCPVPRSTSSMQACPLAQAHLAACPPQSPSQCPLLRQNTSTSRPEVSAVMRCLGMNR